MNQKKKPREKDTGNVKISNKIKLEKEKETLMSHKMTQLKIESVEKIEKKKKKKKDVRRKRKKVREEKTFHWDEHNEKLSESKS